MQESILTCVSSRAVEFFMVLVSTKYNRLYEHRAVAHKKQTNPIKTCYSHHLSLFVSQSPTMTQPAPAPTDELELTRPAT